MRISREKIVESIILTLITTFVLSVFNIIMKCINTYIESSNLASLYQNKLFWIIEFATIILTSLIIILYKEYKIKLAQEKYNKTRPIMDGFRKNNVNYWVFREIRSIIPHL